ncbi:response regulator transcription factor [Candidatus Viridilinea mediisalina]
MNNLTPQEHRVIQLAAQGCTNDQIAQIMGLSASTVKHYLRSACQKLRVPNRTAAVARYYGGVRPSS